MTTSDTDLQPMRCAALRVHAMPEPDAAWLLAALSAEHRAALEPLLHELQALGIPRDPTLAPQLPVDAPTTSVRVPASQPLPAPVRSLQRLDRSGLAALETVLRAEPRAVTMQLLATQPWPWAGRIESKLDVRRQEGPPPNAVLLAALLHAIEAQLAASRVQRPRRLAAWCASAWKRVCTRRMA